MFNQVFKDFFPVYYMQKDGVDVFDDIAKAKSIWHLKKTLNRNMAFTNDTLKEMLILKGIHDAFYSSHIAEYKGFPKPQLLQTLDSLIILTRIPQHKMIAENIKAKVTKLLPGYPAPDFKLFDQDNRLRSLSGFKGKYVYLCFFTTWSLACMQDIELLRKIQDQFGKNLEIVTVICNGEQKELPGYVLNINGSWTFLGYQRQPDIIQQYNIKAYPTYYLIDPYGKLVLSPSPGPNENFSKYFSEILKSRN
jgi:thiol-disulfide isomerase/thioredoxin